MRQNEEDEEMAMKKTKGKRKVGTDVIPCSVCSVDIKAGRIPRFGETDYCSYKHKRHLQCVCYIHCLSNGARNT
jgi:hypothetical protein